MVRGREIALNGLRESRRNRDQSRNLRGGEYGPGSDYRRLNHTPIRATPYPLPQGHARRKDTFPIGHQSNEEMGTKLCISNLDSDVSENDIWILFSDVGLLQSYFIKYNSRGKPTGTAEVTFCHQEDALAAIKRYGGVELDGRPMQIELVGEKLITPAPSRVASAPLLPAYPISPGPPAYAIPPRPPAYAITPRPPAYYIPFSTNYYRANSQVKGNARGQGRGHVFSREATNPGHRREATNPGRKVTAEVRKVTAEELDADLDKYRLEALKSRQSS